MFAKVMNQVGSVKKVGAETVQKVYDKVTIKLTQYVTAKEDGDQYIGKAILILAALAVGALFLTLSKTTISGIFTTFDAKIQEFMNSFTW